MQLIPAVRKRTQLATTMLCIGVMLALAACSSPSNPDAKGSEGPGASSGPFSEMPTEPFKASTGDGKDTGLPKRVASNLNNIASPSYVDIANAMKEAVESRGMEYVQTVVGKHDAAKSVEQLTTLLNRGVGAVFVWDADPDAQRAVNKQLRDTGAGVFTLSAGPGTTPMAADFRQLGATLATSAVDFIKNKLGGKAEVAVFNLDSVAAVKPAWEALREQLTAIGPGVKIVSDVTDQPADPAFGLNTMASILQAHPGVNVVVGLDSTMYNAMQAMKNAGKDPATTFIGGMSGDPRVNDLIASGTSLYKASASFLLPMWGYAPGQWGADWIEGKNVPQLAVIKPFLLNSPESVQEFSADWDDPAGVYKDPARFAKYMELFGTVNYANRTNIWSSTDPVGAVEAASKG
jgi:ribose transport system substrate-binding protein